MGQSKFKPTNVTKQVVSSADTNQESKAKYDDIQTTQQAINMAVAQHRVVRFKTRKSNKDIRREVDDLKGCSMRKPDAESEEVAIIPPGIDDFTFDEVVDESLIVVPKPKIYTPYE